MPPPSVAPVTHAPAERATARQTPAEALWRSREYLRPYYGRIAFMLAAAIAGMTTEVAIPLLTKSVIDQAIAHGSRGLLIPLGLAAIALGVLQSGLNFFRRWIQASAITEMEQAMRDDLYAHLQRLEPAFHDSWQSGQLLSRATTDLSSIRRFASFGVVFFITNLWTFALVMGLLIHLNWWLGLLTGTLFLPVAALCLRFERRYRVLSRRAQDQQGDLATHVEEAAAGIRVLKALGRGDLAAAKHARQGELVYQTQVDKARLRGTFWAALDLAPNIAIGLILLAGALAVAWSQLTIGGLAAYITLTLLLVWPVEAMGYILATGQEAATAAQRVYEILDTEPAISAPGEAQPGLRAGRRVPGAAAPRPGADVPARRLAGGHLVFDQVRFGYPGDTEVLRGLSLELHPGETVALVGATGSGKTTLLQLVPRLADVTGGTVRLDGADIRDLPLAGLRSRIGCAFEDPTLFSASVRDNVGYGAPGAADQDVLSALDTAQAEFVLGLPWRLDTRIGEQGMALSGGQRQRVALARAILPRPEILLLDDPLSALDVHTEAKVTEALGHVLGSATALIVAHRPSTVQLADRVALLAGGIIAATGTHRELLASEPRYRELMSASGPRGTRGPDSGEAAMSAGWEARP
jgi:ATP-binding cassette, subfamily B, bacterial